MASSSSTRQSACCAGAVTDPKTRLLVPAREMERVRAAAGVWREIEREIEPPRAQSEICRCEMEKARSSAASSRSSGVAAAGGGRGGGCAFGVDRPPDPKGCDPMRAVQFPTCAWGEPSRARGEVAPWVGTGLRCPGSDLQNSMPCAEPTGLKTDESSPIATWREDLPAGDPRRR
eukprot:scaffold3649_cov108-Isochrysis_galbana.AAC.2